MLNDAFEAIVHSCVGAALSHSFYNESDSAITQCSRALPSLLEISPSATEFTAFSQPSPPSAFSRWG